MNDVTPTGNSLDLAAAQLRDLCEQRDRFAPPLDAASLERMITHIRNINRSVNASTDDHSNAAKRLTDFSMVLGRIARNAPQGSEDVVDRMRSIAETLKTTGARLAKASPPPSTNAPAESATAPR
jgi:methyl-accepting chemotaxis protein